MPEPQAEEQPAEPCEKCGEAHPAWSRCPFQPGHELSVRHGLYATIKLAPRALELADELREIVPASSPSDEPSIGLLALVLARVETANVWLDEHGIFSDERGNVQPVIRALSTWENTAARLMDRLGLTPTSRAQLGLDLTRAKGEAASAYLAEKRAHEADEQEPSAGA